MKAIIGILMLVFVLTLTSAAQWTPSGSNIFNSNTGNVGIGTPSPTVKLEVNGGGATDVFNLLNEAASLGINARVSSSTDFHASAFTGRRSRGSLTAPINVVAGDRLTGFYSAMFVNGAFRNSAAIQFYAGTSPSSTSFPTNIRFETTANGSISRMERMRISDDGNIGIGTPTPAFKLDVNGIVNATALYVNGVPFSGGSSQWNNNIGSIYYNSGNVGIGTTEPDYKLTIKGGGIKFTNSSILEADQYVVKGPNVSPDQLQGLRINASNFGTKQVYGILGISHSNSTVATSSVGVYGEATGYGNDLLAGWFNGNLGYSGNLYTVSDINLKNNIRDIPSSLELIKKIKPRQYSYKSKKGLHLPNGNQVGFIAQEIKELLPDLVREGSIPVHIADSTLNQEKYLTMDYMGLIPYMLKAIQEQQQIIEKQTELINSILQKNSIELTLIEDNSIPQITKVFPNPTQNHLKVEVFTNYQAALIKISDKEGMELKTIWLEPQSQTANIDLQTLENGIYFLTLIVNGTPFDVKRFIVAK